MTKPLFFQLDDDDNPPQKESIVQNNSNTDHDDDDDDDDETLVLKILILPLCMTMSILWIFGIVFFPALVLFLCFVVAHPTNQKYN